MPVLVTAVSIKYCPLTLFTIYDLEIKGKETVFDTSYNQS
jgi:hypothetical protein